MPLELAAKCEKFCICARPNALRHWSASAVDADFVAGHKFDVRGAKFAPAHTHASCSTLCGKNST